MRGSGDTMGSETRITVPASNTTTAINIAGRVLSVSSEGSISLSEGDMVFRR
jgi:hypothetical protein